MVDTFSKKKRSQIMKAVKSNGNISTEIKLIQIFKEFGITGWRRKYNLPGKPDFVFPIKKIALFTDGCFWHGHNCRNLKPASNTEYWEKKIKRNKKRDKEITKTLSKKGWNIIRVWECNIKISKLPPKLKILL